MPPLSSSSIISSTASRSYLPPACIARSAASQIITVKRRLLVGIHLHGTICDVSHSRPPTFRPRPYLSYLMRTLYQLGCDVHLVSSLCAVGDEAAMSMFLKRYVTVPYTLHYEPPPPAGTSSSAGGSVLGSSRISSFSLLRSLRQGRSPSSAVSEADILFVDAELNYRCSPVNTVVVEAFRHYTSREQRKAYQAYVGDHIPDEAGMTKSTTSPPSHAEAHLHRAVHLAAVSEEVRNETNMVSASGTGGGVGSRAPPASSSAASQATAGATGPSGVVQFHKPVPACLIPDYICVALATIITDLATSSLMVADFLKREALLESLRVPMHRACYFLSKENSEDLPLLNWDEIHVEEEREVRERAEAATGGVAVEETEAHRDLFV